MMEKLEKQRELLQAVAEKGIVTDDDLKLLKDFTDNTKELFALVRDLVYTDGEDVLRLM